MLVAKVPMLCPRWLSLSPLGGHARVNLIPEVDQELSITFTFVTRLFQELKPLFLEAPDGKRHLPGSGIHIRVLDRDFVVDRLRVDEREAFDHVYGVCVEIRRLIEPRLGVLIGHIDNQRSDPSSKK